MLLRPLPSVRVVAQRPGTLPGTATSDPTAVVTTSKGATSLG